MTAIGIDLGTTYSCVAVFQYGIVEIIADEQGFRTTPSYVGFNGHKRLIGEAAKAQAVYNPENTVYDVKRLIGRRFDDATVQADTKHFPFLVVDKDDSPVIKVDFREEEKFFYPEEISAIILGKMKEIAEAYLGSTVKDAVITVPAYFNDSQRQATKDAGTIAGLNVLRIINEPTAAAIAYGLDKKSVGEKNVLIFDLGGGTFDVSILSIDEGIFEVKATCGDTRLGGEDFDHRLVNYFVNDFLQKHGKDISKDKRALRKLKSNSEQVKRSLSSSTQATLEIDSLFAGIDFTATISRAKFEDLCIDLFRNTLVPVKQALEDSEMDKSEIDEIILVGGSTRIPKVQRLLQEFFDGKDLNKSINPDEAVAYGAAVQAAILSGDTTDTIQDLLLLDVLPLSLGIEQSSGLVSKFIKSNTTIPTENQQYFTTSHDDQTQIVFPIFEGERPLASQNRNLGQFTISGIRPAPKGKARVLITFKVDENGIFQVSAEDTETGNKNEVTIKNEKGRLTEAEITQMKHEAEVYFIEDQREVDRIKAMQSLEIYCSQLVSTLDEPSLREKMPKEDRRFIEERVAQAYLWIESNKSASKDDILKEKTEMELVCTGLIRLYL